MTAELNPRFTFDAFVTGGSNQLAVSAARAVAESIGNSYNPLFIYSPTGLGKTHLLMSIGHLARQLGTATVVEYLTLDEFVEAFHAAVAAGQIEALRNRFAESDLLLVDDVQFLADQREMQAELLRFTTAAQARGKQVVLSSDRPPVEISNLDERLISRFAGGLVVDISKPEFETRLAILQRKAEERNAGLKQHVLEAVASFEARNVRELLGMLNRLVAFQAVNDTLLTSEAATALLVGDFGVPTPGAPAAPPPPPVDEFAQFMSNVTSTVTQQVAAWRTRIGAAILRWEGEGYRTARLGKLLEEDRPSGTELAIGAFERDVERLRTLETDMTGLDPSRAGDAVFRDPDRIPEAEALVQGARAGSTPPPGPSAAWAFDDFQPGEANRVALRAALSVAGQPGAAYNPLVLVGPTGVGKTHLLHAIGHALAALPDALVACLSAQDFLDELIRAIDTNRIDTWRSRYRRATAFLLDDVQLLAGKERSQEELFHLFNLLMDSGRQLVFTLNVSPRDIEGLDDRLVSRLDSGLLARIAPPDRELRAAVVAALLGERMDERDEHLVNYLADRPADSIRAVLLLVQRVLSAADAQAAPLTAALARELLEGVTPRPRRSSSGLRTSGVVVSPSGGLRSREKVVWYWPGAADRLIEEMG